MKILLVSQFFFPENFYINQVVATLINKGIKVDVLTAKPNYPEGNIYQGYRILGFQKEKYLGCDIYRIPIIPRYMGSGFFLALNYSSFVISGLLFAPWVLRRKKYDVIFVYGVSPLFQAIPAIFLRWIKNARVALWVQDLWPESLEATGYICNTFVLGFVKQIVKFIYRHSDILLIQSRGFEYHVRNLAPDKKIIYLPNSVDNAFIEPPNVLIPYIEGLDGGFPIIFAGNLGVAQNAEVLLETAILLKDKKNINFVVIGTGSRWKWMNDQISKFGLTNLHLPGRFPINNMPGLMRKAKALLITLADEPIFAATIPNKIQAYMAAGRPILASVNGESAKIIKDSGSGYTTPAGNAPALARAVLKLTTMSELELAEMGERGRQYFDNNFNHDKLMNKLIKIFSEDL